MSKSIFHRECQFFWKPYVTETDPAINFSAEAASCKNLQEQRYTVRFQQLPGTINAAFGYAIFMASNWLPSC